MVLPEGGGKDLENRARLILLTVYEVWALPSHITHALKPDVKGRGFPEYWGAKRAALPKEPRNIRSRSTAFSSCLGSPTTRKRGWSAWR